MIRLQRDRARIPSAFTGATRLKKALELVELAASGPPAFGQKHSAHWKKAKNQLRKEAGDKCAYCESPTSVVAHGDVEHFRPKSVYWWLAFCYDNYTFSCQICNQTFKGDQFRAENPLRAPVVPASQAARKRLAAAMAPDPADAAAVVQFLADCAAENAPLPDPYAVDPERLLAWEADENLKEVRLVPADASAPAKRAASTVVELLGMNRQELVKERYRVFEEITLLKDVAAASVGASLQLRVENVIAQMMAPLAPYAAVARFFGA